MKDGGEGMKLFLKKDSDEIILISYFWLDYCGLYFNYSDSSYIGGGSMSADYLIENYDEVGDL
jgi:hypothetical protein